MPKVNATVANGLGKEKAKEKLDYMVERLGREYADKVQDLAGEWEDDTLKISFKAMGFDIKSNVTVGEEEVDVESQIPLAALPFKGMVQSKMVSTLEQMLS